MKEISTHPIGTTIFAPGKIVLAGEYAVLDGCPSIVLSINRGVQCQIQRGQGITTPDGDNRFVIDALQQSQKSQHFSFSNWNPVKSIHGQKPGFGGSAAACVASCLAGNLKPHQAFEIHSRVQGGGSGIDIASSIHGGMIQYHHKSKKVHPLPPLEPLIIWSKQSAQTGPRVKQYHSFLNRDFFVKESMALVHQFTTDPVHVSNLLFERLCEMSTEANIKYVTPEIQEICSIVKKNKGGSKPSGAGGGDCVVAFFKNDSDKAKCQSMLHRRNYSCIEYQISNGAHIIYPEV
jgi:mevalonate kinase